MLHQSVYCLTGKRKAARRHLNYQPWNFYRKSSMMGLSWGRKNWNWEKWSWAWNNAKWIVKMKRGRLGWKSKKNKVKKEISGWSSNLPKEKWCWNSCRNSLPKTNVITTFLPLVLYFNNTRREQDILTWSWGSWSTAYSVWHTVSSWQRPPDTCMTLQKLQSDYVQGDTIS